MSGGGGGPLVIALGGNAISPEGETDTIENQFAHTRSTAARIVDLIRAGRDRVVITHGNGPQVGNVVLRVENARDIAPWLPLEVCVADTQGGMGYMIQQCLRNALLAAGIDKQVATVVTQVVVDENDPAFDKPTKPIGPMRRLVASPEPRRIVEWPTVELLVSAGAIVIAGGGGGVAVVETKDGLRGVEAVVDKDLTAALLATSIKASALIILTDVEGVYRDFGTPAQRLIEEASAGELRGLVSSGGFPAGSMGPKVDAACRFVDGGSGIAMIGSLEDLGELADGRKGTRIRAG